MKKQTRPFNYKLFLATRRYLVLAVAAGAIASVFLLSLAYPRISVLMELNKKIKTENEKLLRYQSKATELTSLESLPEFQKADEVDKVLPSHKPLLELIDNLNRTATTNKISLKEFSLNPGLLATEAAKLNTKTQKGYNTLEVEFVANGVLKDLDAFMQQIEKISPITSVTTIALNRKEEEVDGKTLVSATADLKLAIHYYTQTVKATLEAPLPKIGKKELEIFETIMGFQTAQLQEQTTVQGGGNEDFFGIDNLQQLQEEVKAFEASQAATTDLGGFIEQQPQQ